MQKYASQKCFIVAELGINHNGSLKTALSMIEAAKECGADAVKIQVFTGEDFYWKDKEFVFGKTRQWKKRVPQLFEEMKLSKAEIREIYSFSREIDIICFSTPLSYNWLEFLEEIGNPIYKIASGDVTCVPFVEEISKIGKPIILSTGKSRLSDVDKAVEAINRYNSHKLGILHCVAAYPTPLDQANLKMIKTYSSLYHCIAGFSDHTEGNLAATVAVAMGARIIEKHFTLDKNEYGPDHWFSMNKEDLRRLSDSIRNVEKMLGDGHKQLLKIEEESYAWGTRCIVMKNDKKKGETIELTDLDFKRPCLGLRPDLLDHVVDRILRSDKSKNQPLKISDLE